MTRIGTTFALALLLGLFFTTTQAGCPSTTSDEDPHAGHDHGAEGDHADHADHAEKTTEAPAMGGMTKVDPEGAVRSWASKPELGAKGICPISGEAFVVTDKTEFSVHEGRYYSFCCDGCQPKFEADPAKYTKAGSEA